MVAIDPQKEILNVGLHAAADDSEFAVHVEIEPSAPAVS